jgi:hypothetical protein
MSACPPAGIARIPRSLPHSASACTAKIGFPGTDMDEPVKTVESLMPWSWLLSGHMRSTLALEARRFATVITLIFADYPPGWAEHA